MADMLLAGEAGRDGEPGTWLTKNSTRTYMALREVSVVTVEIQKKAHGLYG
jgi:hypothetical protein